MSPGRWVDTWRERHGDTPLDLVPLAAADAEDALLTGEVDVAFLRLPLRSEALVRIPLWTEETVVALSRESELTLLETLSPADLADQVVIVPSDDVLGWAEAPGSPFGGLPPASTADALELVAHEAGVCVLPKAIAREAHRRDVVLVPLVPLVGPETGDGADPVVPASDVVPASQVGAASDVVPASQVGAASDVVPASQVVPVSQVGLAWLPEPSGEPTALVEQLIGIVRGRSVTSTRGAGQGTSATPATTRGAAQGTPATPSPASSGAAAPRRSGRSTPPTPPRPRTGRSHRRRGRR